VVGILAQTLGLLSRSLLFLPLFLSLLFVAAAEDEEEEAASIPTPGNTLTTLPFPS
jgi:hypothetical protein